MGIYLNPGKEKFDEVLKSKIYVDKTKLIAYTNSVLQTQQKYVFVSRPRRFGKSITASMLAAYYDRTIDSRDLFKGLAISFDDSFEFCRNKYDVVFINAQDFLSAAGSVEEMINKVIKDLAWELQREYADVVEFYDKSSIVRTMQDIEATTGRKFILIIDEWDCIFREKVGNKKDQERYLDFLREWMKDKSYIALAYMTGILPIKKYGSHSALNMFDEFSMENPRVLAEYVGFTEDEVKALCVQNDVDFEKCKSWYDGYSFPKCRSVYNPKSVVSLMQNKEFLDYWNQTETFEALKEYISMNFDGVRDAIIRMMSGERQRIDTGSFVNDMTTFSNADDVLTLLVHLGYLSYDSETHTAAITNHEILQEFVTSTVNAGWNEVIRSVGESERLLQATFDMDEEKVAELIQKAHLETSHLQYNDENALSYTISLAYYAARNYYTVVRELPAGKGFADLAFIPKRGVDKPAFLVELKWDKSANSAIKQIIDKNYAGALTDYAGSVLLVGINYDRLTKEHECIIRRNIDYSKEEITRKRLIEFE